MIIGVPKEIKNNENRVAITPAGVHALYSINKEVYIQKGAGKGSGFSDEEYIKAGAIILPNGKDIYEKAQLIIKVKEPIEKEYELLKKGQSIFTYLHLAPNKKLTKILLDKKITAIAYETVSDSKNHLPLLIPMSEIAGRMAIQVGATLLQKNNEGKGLLLGGVPGVKRGKILIIGGGTVGTNAAKMAIGLGAHVTIVDINKDRLVYLDDIFNGHITTLLYSQYAIQKEILDTDLLIGAVLIPGAKAPKLVTEQMVESMEKGSVIVDVAIDQGGSIETIDRITTHDNPYYIKHGIIHYSVANMPGAVPRSSTFALTGATLPYILQIAKMGIHNALKENEALRNGLNTYNGKITYQAVKDSYNNITP